MDSQELMRDFLRDVVKPAIDKGVEPAQSIAVFLSAASILAAQSDDPKLYAAAFREEADALESGQKRADY
jgi:hypothetical protein